MDLFLARNKKRMTQEELSRATGISRTLISMIECGQRTPTKHQRRLLRNVFGPKLTFKSKEDLLMSQRNVPEMPIPRWTADGKPDFTHLESSGEVSLDGEAEGIVLERSYASNFDTDVRYKLQDALRERFPGEGFVVVEVRSGSIVFTGDAGNLMTLPFGQTGNEVILADEEPQPVVEQKRTLNKQGIKRAKFIAGQRHPGSAPIPKWKADGSPDFSDLD
jgi:transcriptional regulator with XRE-family HTH domain